MRTTLTIDDDVLNAAHELARRERRTAGQVISDLARRALQTPPNETQGSAIVLGFRPFPPRGVVVTNEDVERLREEGEY